MAPSASIHRPPTPPEGDAPEPSLQEKINTKLVQSGEKDRLKQYLRERLIETGWRDELKSKCRAIVQERGIKHVTVDELSREITPIGRAMVSDSIKAELLKQIRSFVNPN
mmetsp:Transcript_18626/g.22315  ORF Transcript_18626/g.22315 Transcript_18626/m.22315 type:complete len:110 (+) Transcript_18626:146-475(+)